MLNTKAKTKEKIYCFFFLTPKDIRIRSTTHLSAYFYQTKKQKHDYLKKIRIVLFVQPCLLTLFSPSLRGFYFSFIFKLMKDNMEVQKYKKSSYFREEIIFHVLSSPSH